MKNIVVFFLAFSCVLAYSQEEKLPQVIEVAFLNKYPSSKLDNWRVDNDLYYLEFYLKNNSHTSVFDKDGGWLETSEIISDFDIPKVLQNFVADNYPSGSISYCEKVEARNSQNFIRVNLYSDKKFIFIQSEINGSKIKVVKVENEE